MNLIALPNMGEPHPIRWRSEYNIKAEEGTIHPFFLIVFAGTWIFSCLGPQNGIHTIDFSGSWVFEFMGLLGLHHQKRLSIWISRLSKDHPHQGRWASSNPLRDWIEQKCGGRANLWSAWGGTSILSYPWTLALLVLGPLDLDWDLHHWFPWLSGLQI